MAPSADSPTDLVPPPPYQLSQEQFDRKTSHAIQLSSSVHQPIIDGDGWPIYDAAAFEAVAKSYEQTSPGSSSTGGADAPRHGRQASSFSSLPPSTGPMKTKSSERRRRNHQSDPDFPSEPRHATPPPPFSATGPSLDGPPFEEVVTLSYHGPPGPQDRPPSLSPVTPTMALPPPGPSRSQRLSNPPIRTQATQAPPSNPYRLPPDITSRLIPTSAITRVEFDPQMAYANSRNGNNASIQGGASSFYNHAVASQLATSSTSMPTSPQTGYHDRSDGVSSPYSSGYCAGNTNGRYQATPMASQVTPNEPYATRPHNHHLSTPASLQTGPRMVSSTSLPPGAGYAQPPSGAARGPLPPVPYSEWAGSEAHLVQDIYGGHG